MAAADVVDGDDDDDGGDGPGGTDPGTEHGTGGGTGNGGSADGSDSGAEGGPRAGHARGGGGGDDGASGAGGLGRRNRGLGWIGEGGGWQVTAGTKHGNKPGENRAGEVDVVRGGRRQRGARRMRPLGWRRWLRIERSHAREFKRGGVMSLAVPARVESWTRAIARRIVVASMLLVMWWSTQPDVGWVWYVFVYVSGEVIEWPKHFRIQTDRQ